MLIHFKTKRTVISIWRIARRIVIRNRSICRYKQVLIMGRKPHVIVIPYPAQGHVAPLMKLAYKLADHGVKVTFVNTELMHEKIMAAMPKEAKEQCLVRLVSIPDGLESNHRRQDQTHRAETMLRVMPGHLQSLIEKINLSGDHEKISCVIADASVMWALEVAEKLGIKRAAFSPAGLGSLAMVLHIPKLLETGILDMNGNPLKDDLIYLSSEIPPWNTSELPWSCPADSEAQKLYFNIVSNISQKIKLLSNWVLTNSLYELETAACNLLPNVLPIGPFHTSTNSGRFNGSLWPEDTSCLTWLDKQPPSSVIYIAFGSIAIFKPQQFQELALGPELTGHPFLWVVRSDLLNGETPGLPDGFIERVSNRGKIVEWASQEKVLSHSSTACFFSHCGWNSTLEGLSNGVPFLCWPYFADQFHNKKYVCEAWKIGLDLDADEHGTVTRHEIVRKITMLLSDDAVKGNAFKLKEMAQKSIIEGGSSFRNFDSFIQQIMNLDV